MKKMFSDDVTKIFDEYEVTAIKAIARSAGDTDEDVQDAVMVRCISEEFHDGDCILFVDSDNLESDEDVEYLLRNDYSDTYFEYDEDKNIYFC